MEQTLMKLDEMRAWSQFSGTEDKTNWQQTKGNADHIYTC